MNHIQAFRVSRTPSIRGFPIALLCVCALLSCRPSEFARRSSDPTIGSELPAVELEGLTGAEGTLGRVDLRGKVVLINFWATWCPPCLAELPHMAQMAQNLASEPDFRFVSVSTGAAASKAEREELLEKTRATLDGLSLDIPTYADPQGTTFDRLNELGVSGGPAVPTTVLLDRQGIIRSVWVGYRPGLENEMEGRIRELLSQ